ncbi:MAG: hypothetical protein KGI78_03765 [Patescibacteria group bacterium]|nr:hypothetical protein [Patescibacteria group bacterium]MDE1944178.1 hypothetical protein [Patescibacteria group bacterium]MDE1945080.1 hypothetical protein [Patescibacteria group bacterium]MDE2057943.1 hypothetical protein [Patescibacteria group bacterium]
MPDIGTEAYRLWREHAEDRLKDYPGIRDFLFALAQEKAPRRDGEEGETNVAKAAHAFASIPEWQLGVFLPAIEGALTSPDAAAAAAILGEVNKACKRLVNLTIITWAALDQGAAATLVRQQELQNRRS